MWPTMICDYFKCLCHYSEFAGEFFIDLNVFKCLFAPLLLSKGKLSLLGIHCLENFIDVELQLKSKAKYYIMIII